MKASLTKKFILSIKPKEYLKQGPSHCGVYCVKAILSAYGLDDKSHPKFYHPNIVQQETSITWGRNYYTNIFRKYRIDSKMKYANSNSDEKKLDLLKHLLSRDTPVMIRIGNGYITDTYDSFLGNLISHWITLWGYDDDKSIFYIYDSGLPQEFWKNQQAGNTTRTYDEILRDWKFGLWQPWVWTVTGRRNFVYIEINQYGRN